jgi:hypothetical protein
VGNSFDRRVVPDDALAFIRACQRRVPAHLGGGAALSGVHLGHRLSADIDLFCHEAEAVRALVRDIGSAAAEASIDVRIVRDAGSFVRATAQLADRRIEVDIVHDATRDIEAPPPVEQILVESFSDLRAAKLTCILSRSEPRDLVDLLFLDRAGYPPEKDLALALRKDAGIDPGVLAWLLGQFPTTPLPVMLVPLDEPEVDAFRRELRERFRAIAVPEQGT